MVGKEARAAFLRYVDDLRDDVRRLIKQEEVGAPDKSGDIAPRRGAGRRARGARRDPPVTPTPTLSPAVPTAESIPGLPKSVRVEGSTWFVEGQPEKLTTAPLPPFLSTILRKKSLIFSIRTVANPVGRVTLWFE